MTRLSQKARGPAARDVSSVKIAISTAKPTSSVAPADVPWTRSALPVSGFARAVYTLTAAVPAGRVTTYGAIARALAGGAASTGGRTAGAPRAVGSALARNPFASVNGGDVPCHRVVSGDLSLGGFSGVAPVAGAATRALPGELARKVAALAAEGVRVDGTRVRLDEVYEAWPEAMLAAARALAAGAAGGSVRNGASRKRSREEA